MLLLKLLIWVTINLGTVDLGTTIGATVDLGTTAGATVNLGSAGFKSSSAQFILGTASSGGRYSK